MIPELHVGARVRALLPAREGLDGELHEGVVVAPPEPRVTTIAAGTCGQRAAYSVLRLLVDGEEEPREVDASRVERGAAHRRARTAPPPRHQRGPRARRINQDATNTRSNEP